jgi:anti-sigma B factor antagonist
VTVSVRGDVDLATAPKLRAALAGCDRSAPGCIAIDLSAVDHLDSTGLGVLFGALRRARQRGAELHVSAASPPVAALFELLSITAVLLEDCAHPAGAGP